jgi:hypothetical protein
MKTQLLFLTILFAGFTSINAQTTMNIYQSNGTVLQIPISSIDSITYTINNPGNLATLTTLPIGNITSEASTSGGSISSTGGSLVTQRGICWSTSQNPTTANSSTNDGNGAGSFTSSLTGLSSNTTYYVRAYAINSAGTAYGNELMFTTLNTDLDFFLGSYLGNSNCTSGTITNTNINITEGINANEIIINNFIQASIPTTAIVNIDNSISLIPNIIEPNLIQLLSGDGVKSGTTLIINYTYQDLVDSTTNNCTDTYVLQ